MDSLPEVAQGFLRCPFDRAGFVSADEIVGDWRAKGLAVYPIGDRLILVDVPIFDRRYAAD